MNRLVQVSEQDARTQINKVRTDQYKTEIAPISDDIYLICESISTAFGCAGRC